jgi:hypothetical protein
MAEVFGRSGVVVMSPRSPDAQEAALDCSKVHFRAKPTGRRGVLRISLVCDK